MDLGRKAKRKMSVCVVVQQKRVTEKHQVKNDTGNVNGPERMTLRKMA